MSLKHAPFHRPALPNWMCCAERCVHPRLLYRRFCETHTKMYDKEAKETECLVIRLPI